MERILIQREWLEKALKIRNQERRTLFILSCVGIALNGPQWPKIENNGGFSDPLLQSLWVCTEIRQISDEKPGLIQFKQRNDDGEIN